MGRVLIWKQWLIASPGVLLGPMLGGSRYSLSAGCSFAGYGRPGSSACVGSGSRGWGKLRGVRFAARPALPKRRAERLAHVGMSRRGPNPVQVRKTHNLKISAGFGPGPAVQVFSDAAASRHGSAEIYME